MGQSIIEHKLTDRVVSEITLSNNFLTVSFLSQGASIYRLKSKDLDGNEADLVLGHKAVSDYIENPSFLGCTVGRYANRIANGSFTLDGKKYLLSTNEGDNCLHGGKTGLHTKNWDYELKEDSVKFSTISLDGENGFPGHLNVSVTYTLEDESLIINYNAESDADTVINLTNHTYFNLGGHDSGVVFEHEMQILADEYLSLDDKSIPNGSQSVSRTPFDFKVFKPLVAGLRSTDDAIKQCSGYDHCFVLNNESALKKAAIVRHPWSGRIMTVHTTEPGMQLYTANHIDGFDGKDGIYYGRYPAFCLETQHFPNSPNEPSFPSTTLRAGEQFTSKTIYTFTLEQDED